MEKKNVICDTNIWYHIAEGKILQEELSDKRLIGTFITAYELAQSPMIFKKPDIWRKAVEYFFNKSDKLILESPFDYIRLISNYSFKNNIGKLRYYDLRELYDNHRSRRIEEVKAKINKIKSQNNEEANAFMGQVVEFLNGIGNYGQFKANISTKESRDEHLVITMQLITLLCEGIYIDWDKISLYVYVFDEWIYQLETYKGLKIKSNDWNDLFNVLYVNPDQYYWTKDEKKTKQFIISSGNEEYLV